MLASVIDDDPDYEGAPADAGDTSWPGLLAWEGEH